MIARYVCLSWPVAEYLRSYFQISETFVYVTHSFVMAIYSSMVAHCQIVEIWRHLATSVACVLRFIIARHMFIYDNFNILLSKSCSCIAIPWYYTRTWWFEAILYIHYNNNISQQIIVFTLYIAKCATMVSRISWCELILLQLTFLPPAEMNHSDMAVGPRVWRGGGQKAGGVNKRAD